MFQERIESGQELYLHEMMYPVLQGIDSFVLSQVYGSCDLEIGGTDQTFNMLMGRDVMKHNGAPEQAVMSLEILPGTDGKEKMSKSLGNYIAITDEPADMFGKVMSIPDSVISTYFKLSTYTSLEEIEEIEKKLSNPKHNPRDIKMRLAHEIVSIYHGEEAAVRAEKNFVETFSKKKAPKEIETVEAEAGEKLSDILVKSKTVSSKTDLRRLVKEGAVKNLDTEETVTSPDLKVEKTVSLKIGKHRFIKIEVK
jgi:tyrosyl-tRNA synthetase